MNKFYVIYATPDGIRFEECDNMIAVSALLSFIENVDITFGEDFKQGEVMIIKGQKVVLRAKEKTTTWVES